VLFRGDRLRFPKETKAEDAKVDPAKAFAARCYGLLPTMRITDVLSQVEHWTGFTSHFGHVSTGLPPSDERGFHAALIAEATNLGLSRMAEVCNVASRRALIRMQTWHMTDALRDRVVTPSLILKKLSAYRQQNSLAAALREVGRIHRTLFTLRWFKDPALRTLVTAELNKGEARNTLARAVALHRLGRFRDRGHENQQTRAAALNLVTAAIVLFNCRHLDRALASMRARGMIPDEALIAKLSPLGWDHINLTGDYVWSDALAFDHDGFMPLRAVPA